MQNTIHLAKSNVLFIVRTDNVLNSDFLLPKNKIKSDDKSMGSLDIYAKRQIWIIGFHCSY